MVIHMSQTRSNHAETVKRLFRKYSALMYDVAFSILHQTQNAEDAVQDAFLKIMQNEALLDSRSEQELRALVIVITRNAALNMRRKLCRIVYDEERILNEYTADWAQDDTAETLHLAFEQLDEAEQQVLRLKYWEELTHYEIAKRLCISESAAVSRVRRAKEHLKKLLVQEGDQYGR